MHNNNKPRVGIIGGGASGLTTAWLLDNDYDVTLFEKEEALGGHVCTVPITINGKQINVEAGAEFFSDTMFTEFNRLLATLDIPIHKYPLSYTFYNTQTDQTIILPPIHDDTIAWNSLKTENIFDLVEFKHFLNGALLILATKDSGITLDEYCDTIELLTAAFKHEFLYPFLAASWGISPNEVKQLAAYDILQWIISNKPSGITGFNWNEIVGGLNIYINKMASHLINTKIYCHSAITHITYDNNKYIIYNENGKETYVNHLIIATNGHEASMLLKDISHAHELKKILLTIDYFKTTIAIHGDKRLMPKNPANWSVTNIAYDGVHSALTVCKPFMKDIPVFRSWITYKLKGQLNENDLPHPLYAVKHFYHPKPNNAYFKAQNSLIPLQGNNNLWLAGFYTHDVDSHNSAIVSAINIAKKLAPHSERLIALTS